MRLIDADALVFESVGFDAADQCEDSISKFDIDAAPTVSCEECRFQYSRPGYCYECDTDRPGFGCAYFERRQP